MHLPVDFVDPNHTFTMKVGKYNPATSGGGDGCVRIYKHGRAGASNKAAFDSPRPPARSERGTNMVNRHNSCSYTILCVRVQTNGMFMA